MPTPESDAAFDRLTKARGKLNDITRQLNEAHTQMHSNVEARQRHLELQQAWKESFKEFETATDELAAQVKKLHDELKQTICEEARHERV